MDRLVAIGEASEALGVSITTLKPELFHVAQDERHERRTIFCERASLARANRLKRYALGLTDREELQAIKGGKSC